jgi:murein DD-endopeptidase MepM/ murein hydrolase activator NlpD
MCAVIGAFSTRGAKADPPPSVTLPPFTSTTTATTATSTTAPAGGTGSTFGSSTTAPSAGGTGGPPPPPVDLSQDADNGSPLGGGAAQVIPADAQAIMDSIVRSAPTDDHLLVAGEKALLAAGVDPDQAARLAYGRFPVAGPAHWVDDWYAPRFTGTTFRFHLGLDLIAAFGTPLRSPADGVIGIDDSPLGGLAVKVFLPDGTFFYLAHLSATAPGIVPGATVHTGDLLGYVGQSGDATGPHCHFGIYQSGTTPIPPKPVVDQWVADTANGLPAVIASITGGTPRSLIATGIVRELTNDGLRAAETPGGPSRTELLFASSANPAGGALQVAQARVSQAADGIDWTERATAAVAYQRAWEQATARAHEVLDPLTPALLLAAS